MLQNNSTAQTEQTQTLDKLHQAFAAVCHSYGVSAQFSAYLPYSA